MSVILKTSKIRINGEESKWAVFNDELVDADNRINVWGRNAQGEFWFQLERGEDLDEPYLNEWWYKVTLGECTEENHHAPLHLYRWLYRCIKECYKVTRRTLCYRGKLLEFSVLNTKDNRGEGILHIPVPFGRPKADEYYRVLHDNALLVSYGHKGTYDDEHANVTLDFSCPRSAQEMKRMQAVMDASVAEIDGIIRDLYGFSPDNRPTSVDDKVKVAKVIWDWIALHNVYENDDDWREQSLYSALSKGEDGPVCSSYAYASHYLLSRYGIESVHTTGVLYEDDSSSGHAWLMVNYHDDCGMFTEKDNEWCIFDSTGNGYFNGSIDWGRFNKAKSSFPKEYKIDDRKYPTDNPADGDHQYSRKNKYGWDADYEAKENKGVGL